MPQISTSQTNTNERAYGPCGDRADDTAQLYEENAFQHEAGYEWFSLSIANVQSEPANRLTKVIIPPDGVLTRETEFYTTEAIPDAILQNWQVLANAKLSEPAYLFVSHLAGEPLGWRGPDSRPLRSGSLANFLMFWSAVRERAIEPDFVLTPDGNLQAEWYKDNNHFVELEFQPGHQLLFGLFNGESVIEGCAKTSEVTAMLAIQDFKPLKWSFDR